MTSDEEIYEMLGFYRATAEFYAALAKLPLQSQDSRLTSSGRNADTLNNEGDS